MCSASALWTFVRPRARSRRTSFSHGVSVLTASSALLRSSISSITEMKYEGSPNSFRTKKTLKDPPQIPSVPFFVARVYKVFLDLPGEQPTHLTQVHFEVVG